MKKKLNRAMAAFTVLVMLMVLPCIATTAQVIPKSKEFKETEARADMLREQMFEWCASQYQSNTAPTINGTAGKDPTANMTKPVPPAMTTPIKSGYTVRQVIIFNNQGNSRLSTIIRL